MVMMRGSLACLPPGSNGFLLIGSTRENPLAPGTRTAESARSCGVTISACFHRFCSRGHGCPHSGTSERLSSL